MEHKIDTTVLTPKQFWEMSPEELSDFEGVLRVGGFDCLIAVHGCPGFTWMISHTGGKLVKLVWDAHGTSVPIEHCKEYKEFADMLHNIINGAHYCCDCGKVLLPLVDHENHFFAGVYCDDCFPKHKADRDWAYSHLD